MKRWITRLYRQVVRVVPFMARLAYRLTQNTFKRTKKSQGVSIIMGLLTRWIYRYGFKLATNNNTRSNLLMLIVIMTALANWYFCGEGEIRDGFDYIRERRGLWHASELCTWCETSGIGTKLCSVLGWVARYGWFAILYWFFARRDEVGRVYEAAASKVIRDSGGSQDLPDQTSGQQDGGISRPTQRRPLSLAEFFSFDFLSSLAGGLIGELVINRFSRR